MSESQAGKVELLPCPFCGGTKIQIRLNMIGDYYAICDDSDREERGCGASTSDRNCETPKGAIARWNYRAAPPSDDVLALARAVLQDAFYDSRFLNIPRCKYCYAPISDKHAPDCPVPIAQRVIAEASHE